jgi:hypothetical protein
LTLTLQLCSWEKDLPKSGPKFDNVMNIMRGNSTGHFAEQYEKLCSHLVNWYEAHLLRPRHQDIALFLRMDFGSLVPSTGTPVEASEPVPHLYSNPDDFGLPFTEASTDSVDEE